MRFAALSYVSPLGLVGPTSAPINVAAPVARSML
jgi:hypothetical protein